MFRAQAYTALVTDISTIPTEPPKMEPSNDNPLVSQTHWGDIGIMENNMDFLKVYWGYTGIRENEMDFLIVYWVILG